jgi:DNA-binding NarL/FixJ family response regulator
VSIYTVVVVEDDEDMRDVIERTLRNSGHFEVVAVASDAREAIDAIRAAQPDLVLLDHFIHGKVMGLDTAPVIKAVAPETKLVVFTEKDFGLEAYFEPEVDAHLRKEELARLTSLALRLVARP